MIDMTSNVPPGFKEVYVSSAWLNRGRSSPPVGGPQDVRRKELLDFLQKGVDKMNKKNDKV